jgi:hypothetical protein
VLLLSSGAMYEVVWRPWTGELHPALLQLQSGGRVFILIALNRFIINKMSDIKKHLSRLHPFAGNLFGNGKKHTMHLDGECTRFGLAFPLAAGALTQAGQVLLADGHVAGRVAWAGIVDEDLEMHLGLATKPLDIGLEVTLIGADGAAERIVILKGGAKTKGQDGGELETVRDDTGMVFCSLLVEPLMVFGAVLRNDNGQITGGKQECLITE